MSQSGWILPPLDLLKAKGQILPRFCAFTSRPHPVFSLRPDLVLDKLKAMELNREQQRKGVEDNT